MTEAVDLDRLADYIGGALDGTPEADSVARLIAEDARWASAASTLERADSLVRADLHALAALPEPMPAEVSARIDGALQSAPPALSPVAGSQADARTAGLRDRRRRMRRWTAAAAVAAGVVALGFGVVTALPDAGSNNNAPTSGQGLSRQGESNAQAGALPPGLGAASGARVVASGNDYRRGGLSALADAPVPGAAPRGSDMRSVNEANQNRLPDAGAVPDALSRLRDPVALKACVDAVQGEYGGKVTLIDFARFEGRPAVVILLAGAKGRGGQWAVVVGPDCGLGGGIADELFNGPV
jgi:hypothetical protein